MIITIKEIMKIIPLRPGRDCTVALVFALVLVFVIFVGSAQKMNGHFLSIPSLSRHIIAIYDMKYLVQHAISLYLTNVRLNCGSC